MKGESPPPSPLVLGIESSCDDTACAVLDGSGRVLSSVVSSQLAAHRPYGGVVPEIASREHLRNWPAVRTQALQQAGVELRQIEVVAATRGPGLVGSLLVGLSLGKGLAYGRGLPFYGVHHLEGHLVSPYLALPGEGAADDVPERFLGLVVSGGHTALYEVSPAGVETLGETRDDAMGECFDKVGKRLGLPFPGGPLVDRLAERAELDGRGRATLSTGATLHYRTPRCGDTLDFSYSGLKTQAQVDIEKLERQHAEARGTERTQRALGGQELVAALDREGPSSAESPAVADAMALLGALRHAAVRQLVDRLDRRYRIEPFSQLAVSGGVAANRLLRREIVAWGDRHGVDVRLVPLAYCGDNAAMIAHAALRRHLSGAGSDSFEVDAVSRLPVG